MQCRDVFFFFNDTATTEIYTLSLHDALPIYVHHGSGWAVPADPCPPGLHDGNAVPERPCHPQAGGSHPAQPPRSEEHTSELQSRQYLVCRLLLEKKKIQNNTHQSPPPRLSSI